MSFSNKQILVIGGSSGIGQRIVADLASAGARIITASRNEGTVPDGSRHVRLDVTEESLDSLADALPEKLDGMVYCPGTILLKSFRALKIAQVRNDLEVNYIGAVKSLQIALPALLKSDAASVVLFSTVAAGAGMSFHASIAPAKAAVEGLVRSLAAEFARQQVRFNAIAPSLTDTPLAETLLADESKREASAKRHPLGRIGTPADIASAALYLLSDQASWVTGQVLGVDGGLGSLRPL